MTRIAIIRFWLALVLCGANLTRSLAAQDFDHQLEIELQPASGEIRIVDRVQVTGVARYRFQLAEWISEVEVEIDGRGMDLERQGNEYVIELPGQGAHQVDFDLRGKLPARGGAESSEVISSHGEGGVFLPGYDDWMPHPRGVEMSYRLEVSVPATQRVVVSGELLDEQFRDGRYHAIFGDSSARETPSLFAGEYALRERQAGDIRLRTYFHPELGAHADEYLAAAENYLQRYQRDIGAYPYRHFYIVSAPLPVGLGFPGLAYVDRRIVPLPFMRTRSLAHEVLHNWWGNGVAVDYANGNWAEGLTTYMADYALEAEQGDEASHAMRVQWLRDYAALPAARDQPVRTFRSRQHQASQVIGYNKAAFIFHMLNQEIGQQAFDEGIRRFWRDHRSTTASWRDLQASFEQAAGRDLDWFFRQWLEPVGAPRPALGAHRVTRVDDGYLTQIEILQPVAGYRFKLVVLLETDSGSERRDILVDTTKTNLEWITADKPLAIRFDPGSDLFRRLRQDETPPILRDITLNAKTLTVIVGDDAAFNQSARLLAGRLLDTAPDFLASGQPAATGRPLLVIAPRAQLAVQLASYGLEVPAGLPRVKHRAAAWTARLDNALLLVVSAENAAELQAMARPLPHYGGQSYVLFDGGRALSRGLWPLPRGSLYRDLRGDY